MEKSTVSRYLELRRKGEGGDSMLPISARHALHLVRHENAKRALPISSHGDTWESPDGFTAVLRVENDDLSLADMLGDSYGQIVKDRGDFARHDGPGGYDLSRNGDGYSREIYWPNDSWTYRDRLQHYRKAGLARQAAHEAALAGLKKEAETFEKMQDEYESFWIQVKVYRTSDYDENGSRAEEWGEDSIGGVDDVESCLADYCLLDNAMEAARGEYDKVLEQQAREEEESRPDMYGVAA